MSIPLFSPRRFPAWCDSSTSTGGRTPPPSPTPRPRYWTYWRMWTPGRNSSKTRRSPSTACKAKLWLKQFEKKKVHYLLIFVSLSYGFNFFYFVFCILVKKTCLPIFVGLFISIPEFKVKIWSYVSDMLGEKFDHL